MKAFVLICCLVGAAAALGQGREYEFSWDTGVWGSCVSHQTGKGTWFANDFTLREYD